MTEKKSFEMPTITTFDRDELIVETAFTAVAPSNVTLLSDRTIKANFSAVAARDLTVQLLRIL